MPSSAALAANASARGTTPGKHQAPASTPGKPQPPPQQQPDLDRIASQMVQQAQTAVAEAAADMAARQRGASDPWTYGTDGALKVCKKCSCSCVPCSVV